LLIFPLGGCQRNGRSEWVRSLDQKLKKFLTSSSGVSLAMLLTWTVEAMFVKGENEKILRFRRREKW
jgi:hypothetical protein